MSVKLLKQIGYAVIGLLLFWMAGESYQQVGLAAKTFLPATLGTVLVLLAVTGKTG